MLIPNYCIGTWNEKVNRLDTTFTRRGDMKNEKFTVRSAIIRADGISHLK